MTTDSSRMVPERLADHVAFLQGAFRKLSKAATRNDLAVQFARELRAFFHGSRFDVLFMPTAGAAWELAVDGGAGGPKLVGELVTGERASALHVAGEGVLVVQKLVDGSSIAVVEAAAAPTEDLGASNALSLQLFVQVFSAAYQEVHHRRAEKELVFSLNQRVLQLNSLIDTGIEIAKLDREASPHRLALERAAALTNASRGRVKVTADVNTLEEVSFPSAEAVRAIAPGASCICSAFAFAGATYTFELFEKESRKGVIPFEETDQVLLDALARQVHASLENRDLHKQALEKQRIEQDVAVAASIQQRILPASLPVIDGYDVAGVNIPSKSVGGDYYDCIALSGGRYALVIADVAGKGIPAALLVSSLHAYLSAYLEEGLALVDLARRLNRVIGKASTDDKFITAFIAILDPASGAVESVNAGHTTVYWHRADGTLGDLSKGGLPLGMLDADLPYETESITLGRGDRLLLYTDGIPEAHNPDGVLFDTVTPLRDLFMNSRPEEASAFIRLLLEDLRRFTRDAPQGDDITAMCLVRR